MNTALKSTAHEQRQSLWQLAQATKRPYMVRNVPETVLYLTTAQAAKRFDLIPQFRAVALGPDS